MLKSVWGPATWNLLHCMVLATNENIETAPFIDLKNMILRILSNLPCPYCTSHALSLIASSNFKSIQNMPDLRLFMFQFHNKVNQQVNKPLITYDEHILIYCNLNLTNVLQHFIDIYNQQIGGVTMMLYGFHRKQMLIDIYNFFKRYRNIYIK